MTQGLAFEPTEDRRRLVRGMAAVGVSHENIATLLEIDAKTLRKHFRHELDRGSIEATAKVAQSLFQMATQGKNVAAAIFWMKVRGGWTERLRSEVLEVENGPTRFSIVIGPPSEQNPELIGE